MAKRLEHRKALELRKLGKSYSQIKNEINVSKSSLSLWLKEYPLSSMQLRLLRDLNETRIEKYRQTMLSKRQAKQLQYYNDACKNLLPLTKRELFIAGLFLYWGEGGKTERGNLSISNTDPAVLMFTLYWMRVGLEIPKPKIQVLLHLYSDMNPIKTIIFWSKTLQIPVSQFSKPYIKISKRSDLDEKGHGYGTCLLRVNNTILKEKIITSIRAISDYSNRYIPEL